MLDKELFKLIGGNRKYVAYTVLLMVLGMLANIGITASVCWAVALLIGDASPAAFLYPRSRRRPPSPSATPLPAARET